MTVDELDALQAERAARRVIEVLDLECHGNALVAAFKALPTLIAQPGDFLTRDGRRATIHTVGPISVQGRVWKEFRGKLSPRGYFLWEPNGRTSLFEERKRDIVGPWIEEATP